MYVTRYVLHRTTIYLSEELRQAIKRTTKAQGETESSFIRRVLSKAVNDVRPPRPRLPLFSSGDKHLAERVDEALAGFGES